MTAMFDLVAAADEKGGLGYKGDIPWHLPGDLKFLKKLTRSTQDTNNRNAVLMGRVTWETIPAKYQPLPGRFNVVISRNRQYPLPEGVGLAHSLEEAVALAAEDAAVETIFVLGGAQIYQHAIRLKGCRRIYLTRIHAEYPCDAFFPSIDEDSYRLAESSQTHEHKGVKYVYQTWERQC